MFLPTVFCNKTNMRHIVKDQNTCLCGIKYNVFSTFTRKDFKKIKFKSEDEISCSQCRSIIH